MANLFNYTDDESLGSVIAVDTATVTVRVDNLDRLRRVQVNRLIVIQSSRPGQHLLGIVERITRRADDGAGGTPDDLSEFIRPENNIVRVALIGTLLDKVGTRNNVFRRTLETVPEIDALCFALEGERLTRFMEVIALVDGDGPKLSLGRYTIDEEASAYLNGNKLFQRHAVIVGSTGSGKSWTTARLLDQISDLHSANVILLDMHGEYKPLKGDAFRHLKIAGAGDATQKLDLSDGMLFLPYWLLGYEALSSLFVDRSDQNAPNQTMMMLNSITEAKKKRLDPVKDKDILDNFTIDSPIPFDINDVLLALRAKNEEMVPGAAVGKEKQGPYFDKLTRLIARLESKISDRRLAFLFQPPDNTMKMEWLSRLVALLVASRSAQHDKRGGIKIIDFSEVPSDILPLIVSLVARLVFTSTQWTLGSARHPIALLCDEAHLYIPERGGDSADVISTDIFERIAKEGRKYGIGLVVISQRPSEVNRTVLSQCNNVIAMRLTNGDDQSVIKRLLPDSLGGFGDLLPVLDVGEALVVGDASLLPTRVRIAEPKSKPDSQTVSFWDQWSKQTAEQDAERAVAAWRRQSFR